MKPKIKLITYGGLLLFFCLSAVAQGTAFTYQGRLNNGSNPANGSYDLAFTLFATNATGVAIAGPVTNSAVSVTSGLFTTTVNFGNAFIGGSNWLQIAVSTNGANAFSTLLPRQQLTPVPYAVLAENVSGVISAAQLPNGLGGVNNGAGGSFATVSGGNFNEANGGWATVGGGDGNAAGALFGTVGGGHANNVGQQGATVAGGENNTASGLNSTVSGGLENTASGQNATVAGGGGNIASGNVATVAGGYGNTASGLRSYAAGTQAQALNDGAFVWADSQLVNFSSTNNDSFNVRAQGGARFETSGAGMTIDGQSVLTTGSGSLGLSIQQNSDGAPNVILGSSGNFVSNGVVGATIGGGGATNYFGSPYTNSVTANFGTVGGGYQNTASGEVSTVSGGVDNTASGIQATVDGGYQNTASGDLSTVSGGDYGIASGYEATISGGLQNTASAEGAMVPGGEENIASGLYSFAAGSYAQALNDGAFVWADSQSSGFSSTNNDSFNVLAHGGARFVTGGAGMSVDGPVTVTGGSVGIGTTTPAAGLDVESSPTGINHGNWGYLQQPGYTPGPLSGSPNLDIYTSGSIGASTYYAFSDERIKNVIGVSSSVKDLNTLMAIHVTDYTYKDTVTHGNGPVKKVIAQQVESVYPQAVFKTVGVIPDIYRQATIKDGWIQLATSLKVGEKVKLIGESGQGIYQVLEVRLGEFRTDFKTDTDQVFVFGRQVDDFRNVDYEALSTLNISATQELAKRLAAESSEVSALKQELAEMKEVMAQLRDNQETQLTDKTTPQTRARASIRQPLITASLEN